MLPKVYHECSFQQGNAGNIDPQHLSFLLFFLREDPAEIELE